MAQQMQDTEGLDTATFLKSNGLSDLLPKFEAAQFTIEDLLICTRDEIKEICDTEFNLKTTQKIRLIKAIQSIPHAAVNKKSEPQKIIFLGEQERKLLDKLHTKTDIVSNNIKQIQIAMDELAKSAVECTKDVHNKYNEIVAILEKRRKVLLDKITNLKSKRYQILQKHLNDLKLLNDVGVKASEECRVIACKANIASNNRLDQMEKIVNKFDNDEQKMNVNNDIDTANFKLCLNFNQQVFKSNVEKLWDVGFDDAKFEVKQMEKKELWKFQDNHERLVVSNNGLTVNESSGKYGTILFGKFIESGFVAIELTFDRNGCVGALCIIGKQFKTWNSHSSNEDWIQFLSHVYGKPEWKNFVSELKSLSFEVNETVGIMIDMDNHVAEFKNKTKNTLVKVNLPKRACAIALYCNNCQFTVTKQMFSKYEYDNQ